MSNNTPVTKDVLQDLKELIDEKIGRVGDLIGAHISEEGNYRRTLENDIRTLRDVVENQQTMIESNRKELDELKKLTERYKGAIGILAIIGSCVLAAVTIFKDRIATFFTGG